MTTRKWVVGALILAGLMLAVNVLVPRGGQIIVGEAFAQNRAASAGDYVVATARTSSSIELLYVVDVRLKKLVVYATKRGGRTGFSVLDGRDLDKDLPGGCTGQVLVQPLEVSDDAAAVTVMDVVNRKMVVYLSRNFGKLEIIGGMDVAKDFGD